MTDQSGFAALDATITKALLPLWKEFSVIDGEEFAYYVRVVREALLADWPTVDAAIETHCASLKRPLGGRDQPHTTPRGDS